MKKLLVIAVAVLAMFGVVSCGGGGTTPEKITITFDNGWIGFPAAEKPADRVINKGAAIGELPAAPATPPEDGYEFVGWFYAGDKVEADTRFEEDVTLRGRWAKDDEVWFEFWTITYLTAHGTAPAAYRAEQNQPITAAALPNLDAVTGWVFAGWFSATGGTGSRYAAADVLTDDATFHARWVTTDLTENGALEKLSLMNGGKAMYKFDLDGNMFDDYEKLEVSYKLSGLSAVRQVRSMRLYGDFTPFVGQLATGTEAVDGYRMDANDVRAMRFDPFNGGFIADTIAGSGWAADVGVFIPDFVPNVWFTVEYGLSGGAGSDSNSPNGSSKGNVWVPGDFDEVLWFALGISGVDGDSGYITQLVKDIRLVHKTDPALNIYAQIPGANEVQFACYIDPIVKQWRGAPDAVIEYPEIPEDEEPDTPRPVHPGAKEITLSIPASWVNAGDNAANQHGWRSEEAPEHGMTGLTFAEIFHANKLVIELNDGRTPAGLQIAIAHEELGWRGTPNLFSWGGIEQPAFAEFGGSWDVGTRTVTFDLDVAWSRPLLRPFRHAREWAGYIIQIGSWEETVKSAKLIINAAN